MKKIPIRYKIHNHVFDIGTELNDTDGLKQRSDLNFIWLMSHMTAQQLDQLNPELGMSIDPDFTPFIPTFYREQGSLCPEQKRLRRK